MAGMRAFELWLDNTQIPPGDLVGVELIVESDQVDVTPMSEPDPTWETVDAAGHWHAAAVGKQDRGWWPTLRRQVSVLPCALCAGTGRGPWSHYMDDYESCEECDGTGEEESSYLACVICKAQVVPGTRTPPGRVHTQGQTSWRIEAHLRGRAAGEWVRRSGADLEGQVVARCRGRRGDSPGPWWFGVAQLHVPQVEMSGSDVRAEIVLHGVGELGQR